MCDEIARLHGSPPWSDDAIVNGDGAKSGGYIFAVTRSHELEVDS